MVGSGALERTVGALVVLVGRYRRAEVLLFELLGGGAGDRRSCLAHCVEVEGRASAEATDQCVLVRECFGAAAEQFEQRPESVLDEPAALTPDEWREDAGEHLGHAGGRVVRLGTAREI